MASSNGNNRGKLAPSHSSSHLLFLSITPFATLLVHSSMHICASQTDWATLTTTFIRSPPSTHLLLSSSTSTPMTVSGTPFDYHSTHRTPTVYVPVSSVRSNSQEETEFNGELVEPLESTLTSGSKATSTQTPTQTHGQTSATAIFQADAYALPPPEIYPRFVFKPKNVEYTIEDTTDSESIYDVGHHWQLPPPRIYFPESLITYVPPYCSDLLPRDPEIKGIPRNYRSWTRTGRPRLEVDGVTRNDARTDFSSIGLVWRGSGNDDEDSESELSDGKGDDKRKRKKKKFGTRKNVATATTVSIERPKRMVRRIAEADGQLRITPGSVGVPSTNADSPLEKTDKSANSRAHSLARSSLPSSRAQSPMKRRKVYKLDAEAEAGTKEGNKEKDVDGGSESNHYPDREIQNNKHSRRDQQNKTNRPIPIPLDDAKHDVPNQALSESSSVTLIDVDDCNVQRSKGVDADVPKVPKQMSDFVKRTIGKRKRLAKAESQNNPSCVQYPSKKSRPSRCDETRGRPIDLKENVALIDGSPVTLRTTRSTTTAQTALKGHPARGGVGKVTTEYTPAASEANTSESETEEEQDSGDDDGTFTPTRPDDPGLSLKSVRASQPRSRPTRALSGIETSDTPSCRPTRAMRAKLREPSPSAPHDITASSGSESKGNTGPSSIPISRPHHRATQATALAVPIPMRTFEPTIPIIEGYAGFYRRYPLILQFDTSGGTSESGSPSKKNGSFGDPEKYILAGVSSDLVANPKRPLGNFNPPRDIRDLYTPRYTKGSGGKKLALCPICFEDPRRGGEGRQEWNHTKTSQHNYHMQYYHGISASRFQPFSPPIAHRTAQVVRPQSNEKSEILQGKCHHCRQWIALEGCKVGELKVKELFWWKHAAGCHKDSKLPGERDVFIEDEAYQRLLQYEAEHSISSESDKQFISPSTVA